LRSAKRIASALGAGLHGFNLRFGGADGVLGGGDEAVKSLLGLGDALFRQFAHFSGNFEFHVFHHRNLLTGQYRRSRFDP
jgi:hypothetical protein